MKRTLLATLLTLASLAGAPSAAAGDTKCVGSLAETYDNIVVPAGATCTLSGAHVRGSVSVRRGAELFILTRPDGSGGLGAANPTIINGNVQAENASWVSVFHSRVLGNVQLKGGSEGMSFFHATVAGNVQVEGMAGRVDIVFSTFGGGLEVTKSFGGIRLLLNAVGGSVKVADNVVPSAAPFFPSMSVDFLNTSGDLQVVGNRGPGSKRVTGNFVRGSVQCFGNTPTFVGDSNIAGKLEGQCS